MCFPSEPRPRARPSRRLLLRLSTSSSKRAPSNGRAAQAGRCRIATPRAAAHVRPICRWSARDIRTRSGPPLPMPLRGAPPPKRQSPRRRVGRPPLRPLGRAPETSSNCSAREQQRNRDTARSSSAQLAPAQGPGLQTGSRTCPTSASTCAHTLGTGRTAVGTRGAARRMPTPQAGMTTRRSFIAASGRTRARFQGAVGDSQAGPTCRAIFGMCMTWARAGGGVGREAPRRTQIRRSSPAS